MKKKVCASCRTPWVRKGTAVPLTGIPRDGVGEPACACQPLWMALEVEDVKLTYTPETLQQLVANAPIGKPPIYSELVGTRYSFNATRWFRCREVFFGNLVSSWRNSLATPGPWSIYVCHAQEQSEV